MKGMTECQSKTRCPNRILKRPAGTGGPSAASGGPIGSGGAASKKPPSATLAAGSRNKAQSGTPKVTPKEKKGWPLAAEPPKTQTQGIASGRMVVGSDVTRTRSKS